MSQHPHSTASVPQLTIEAGKSEGHYWADVWRFRELLYFLTWRDLLVRYKQTVIGVAWALIQPLTTTAVFCAFSYFAKLPTSNVPRPVLIFVAQLPWQFFSSALSASGNSLVANSHLISKVYFPRMLVPMSAVAVSLVDFIISAVMLALLMGYYGIMPDARIAALPALLGLALAAAFGAGLWFTALNVRYRDFRYVLPFLIQFGIYISPVSFTSDLVPLKWRWLYSLNPMVGVIDGFRWSLLGGKTAFSPESLYLSVATVAIVLVSGIWYFRRTERSFADVI